MFSQARVKELLKQYVLVQLYTDNVPPRFEGPVPTAEENKRLLNEGFGTAQLPTYVIVRPKPGGGYEVVDRYEEGKINDVDGFVRFLQKPLGGGSLALAPAP